MKRLKRRHEIWKQYDIWVEGFSSIGGSAEARYLGKYTGVKFKDACLLAVIVAGMKDVYNYGTNTVWGSRLFDNESDARRAFG